MTDIVDRLRSLDRMLKEHAWTDDPCIREAADLIESLLDRITTLAHTMGGEVVDAANTLNTADAELKTGYKFRQQFQELLAVNQRLMADLEAHSWLDKNGVRVWPGDILVHPEKGHVTVLATQPINTSKGHAITSALGRHAVVVPVAECEKVKEEPQ